jgi:hypothetical protein
LQAVGTGQTSNRTNNANSGTNGVVASNNTKIFSYCFSSATALSVKSTTNGTTWTTETVTGLPTFSTTSSTIAHASQSTSGNSNTFAATTGWKRNSNATSQFAVFWCGARFLLLAPDGINFVASLSTNGFTFGGDNTTAVLGSAGAAPQSDEIQFYRNGNSCFLNVGGAYRFTTDGGVTWAASTFAAAPNPDNYLLQYNTTDPAKLVIINGISSSEAYYTADSGATWSASRPLPSGSTNGGLYYKGSTLVFSNRSALYKVSTDDGVTWVTPTLPIGVLSTQLCVFADANRFYAGVVGQSQLLTSSDAVTWTLVTLPQAFELSTNSTQGGYGIITYAGDSNTVILLGYNGNSGYNQAIYSLDGGVTWTGSQYTNSNTGGTWNVGNVFTTPDAGGVAFAYGSAGLTSANSTNVLKADITAGGAFYRTGVTGITPIRTGSNAYVRVG